MSKKKFVAYYRVSTDKQGKSGLGLEAQEKAVKKYLKTYWPPHESFTEVESGKNNKRPELHKALKLCKKLKATLIVAKLDRLSRDLHFITSLDKAKIKFVCCDMPEANNLTINLMGVLAQWEREQISKRTKDALQALKARGKKLGANNPKTRKGLEKIWKVARDKKKIEAKEKRALRFKKTQESNKKKRDKKKKVSNYQTYLKESSEVRMIKAQHNLGNSPYKIAEVLNKNNQTTRFGNKWTHMQVYRILKALKLKD